MRSEVRIDRSNPEQPVLTYRLEFDGPLTPEQATHLRESAANGPVGKTLTGKITVRGG